MKINSNINAHIAANALSKNQRVMGNAMERLSTGVRINSARDDAAGLAITSKMTSQINGLKQAVRNTNDAISMLQVAEGATVEITNMLQRMRELAVQAANGANTANDREALDKEFQHLSAEIDRISKNTQWNGKNLLDGTGFANGTANFQIGANADQTIEVNLGKVNPYSWNTAEMQIKVKSEFQVNTETTDDQIRSSVTSLADGGFVVIWESSDTDDRGIHGQLYASDGTTQGNEFQVNTYTSQNQTSPSVTSLTDGSFIVAWQSLGQEGAGSKYGIYGQRYASDGSTNGSEFQVNTHITGDQKSPSVTSLADGGFVVAWTSENQDGSSKGVFGQRFASDGAVRGAEFQINTHTESAQEGPTVASLADGGFVVTWTSENQDSSGSGVFGQRYNSDGTSRSSEFQVNTYISRTQHNPSVTSLVDGSFVVTWDSVGQDAEQSNDGVFGQRYASNGTAQGGEFQVHTYLPGDQNASSVGALDDGGFIVTWNSYNQDSSGWGIYGQRYSADGTAKGNEFQVNAYENESQYDPSFTPLVNGEFVVTWSSQQQDGSGTGIYGQHFATGASLKTAENATTALGGVDRGISFINDLRSSYGAAMNRLEYAADNLTNIAMNTEAARSRILDTDYASETTELARTQIIQQAATAMLTQANQQAKYVLELLKSV